MYVLLNLLRGMIGTADGGWGLNSDLQDVFFIPIQF